MVTLQSWILKLPDDGVTETSITLITGVHRGEKDPRFLPLQSPASAVYSYFMLVEGS